MPSMHLSSQRISSKSERLEARVSFDQKQLFLHAADVLGISLTDFMISSLNHAAMDIVEKENFVRLSARDCTLFVKALLKPPAPSSRLIAAKKRHQRLIKKEK